MSTKTKSILAENIVGKIAQATYACPALSRAWDEMHVDIQQKLENAWYDVIVEESQNYVYKNTEKEPTPKAQMKLPLKHPQSPTKERVIKLYHAYMEEAKAEIDYGTSKKNTEKLHEEYDAIRLEIDTLENRLETNS